jgi:hypothetical protein
VGNSEQRGAPTVTMEGGNSDNAIAGNSLMRTYC